MKKRFLCALGAAAIMATAVPTAFAADIPQDHAMRRCDRVQVPYLQRQAAVPPLERNARLLGRPILD